SFRSSSLCVVSQALVSASRLVTRRSAPPRLDRLATALLPFTFVPTYEYECPKCPRVFEVRQRITEPALTTCDRCGGPIHRLPSPPVCMWRGGGGYAPDSQSEARKQPKKPESPPSESSPPPSTTPAAEKSSTSTPTASEKAGSSKTEKSPAKSTEKAPA